MIKRLDETKNLYRTADFPTICTLYYLNFDIDSFEHDLNYPSRVAAFFKQTAELDTALQSLRSRQLAVEPLTFLETTRSIKARLRDCV